MEWNLTDGWASGLGTAGISPARTTLQGIYSVDMTAQKTSPLLYFNGTSYRWHVFLQLWDFRVLEDGTMEYLWTDFYGKQCIRERMHMEKVVKIPVVLRGSFAQDNWLSDQVSLFNQKSRDYHVLLETCGSGNDAEDFARAAEFFMASAQDNDRDGEELAQACCVVAKAARLVGDTVNFFKYSSKVIAQEACSEICCEMGHFYAEREDWEEAAVWFYNAVYETQPILNLHAGGREGLEGLILCYEELACPEQAQIYQEELAARCPGESTSGAGEKGEEHVCSGDGVGDVLRTEAEA
mgnify:CR=1 FL=1